MKAENRRIDVHYHIIPAPYVEALSAKGITGATWARFPKWTPESAIKHMDRMRVATAITSLSTPGVWFDDAALARNLSRRCNEFQARMMADHPKRFGALAFLPLPDVAGALAEMEYALDRLGHDGVALLSDVGGHYLGDPSYEELFAELDRRHAVVFVHPHDDPRRKRRYDMFSPLLEWPIHTTRAAMDLLYSGRLARYPNIRYILAHGGGTVPYLADRIAAGPGCEGKACAGDHGMEARDEGEVRNGLQLLRSLYYDSAAPGNAHLTAIQELAGPSHIVFGTDGGWTPPIQTALTIKALLAFDGFTASELSSVERNNAAALFPRFGETPLQTPDATVREESTTTVPPIIRRGQPLVDVHHHVVPPEYRGTLGRLGADTSGLPIWTPDGSLALMDRLGIAKALLSVSPPGVWFGDDAQARSLARACNEYLASLKRKHPARFGGLASLPFPDLDGSRQEIVHALDDLDLDGVLLFSNVGDRYVGDPEFDALLRDLHERRTTVLLHPNDVPEDAGNAPLHLWAEYPIDLARAYARLVYHGAFLRYPGIRWILAHGGGVVPFLAERLGKAHYAKGGKPRWGRIILDLVRNRDGGLELAKGLRYDTVGAANPVTLAALLRLVGPEQVCFGSNFPWDREDAVHASLRVLRGEPHPGAAHGSVGIRGTG